MYVREASASLFVLLFGCAGTSTGNPASPQPSVRILGENTFLILKADADNCSAERTAEPSKLSPTQELLSSRLGSSSAEFIVLMKREISLQSYPLPSDRANLGEDDEVSIARATEIARSQGCTLDALADDGGDYVHSFLLINAFVAELTVDQAVALSGHPDVRAVELSQGEPLP